MGIKQCRTKLSIIITLSHRIAGLSNSTRKKIEEEKIAQPFEAELAAFSRLAKIEGDFSRGERGEARFRFGSRKHTFTSAHYPRNFSKGRVARNISILDRL